MLCCTKSSQSCPTLCDPIKIHFENVGVQLSVTRFQFCQVRIFGSVAAVMEIRFFLSREYQKDKIKYIYFCKTSVYGLSFLSTTEKCIVVCGLTFGNHTLHTQHKSLFEKQNLSLIRYIFCMMPGTILTQIIYLH